MKLFIKNEKLLKFYEKKEKIKGAAQGTEIEYFS